MSALLFSLIVGLLAACGLYLVLRRHSFDLVLGMTLLSYAVNLFIFAMGGLKIGATPIIHAAGSDYADPLPPALVLTAIVIGLAMTALLLALAIRQRQQQGGDRIDRDEDASC
jgi:multicomponent K+:H+ antiporter subunit C